MKKICMALLLGLSLTASAQVKNATLTASGLTCSMCSKAIYDALKKIDFVQDVQANIKTSAYAISFREGATIDLDALGKAVEDAGFSVARLKVNVAFAETPVANDTHVKVGSHLLHFVNVKAQTLKGEKEVTLLDKKFISAKEHKKFAQYTRMKCYNTGVAEACCAGGSQGERIYHVTI